MRYAFYILIVTLLFPKRQLAQEDSHLKNSIMLDSLVILADNDFNIHRFVQKVRDDSSFYQSFKNLRYYPHFAKGSIKVLNRKNKDKAYEEMIARQFLKKNKMWQQHNILRSSGKMRDKKGNVRFTTAQMYYDAFFPQDTLPVSTAFTSVKNEKVGDSKKAQYKHQVKVMMFNPGETIEGIPLVGKKMSIFDEDMLPYYDYRISQLNYNNQSCYVFNCLAKSEFKEDKTVIKSLITYFDQETMQVLKRISIMKYRSLLFDFDVTIEVENKVINQTLVPVFIKYRGYWDIPFKTQENIKFVIENYNFTFSKD